MSIKYFPAEFEGKWIKQWEKEKIYDLRFKNDESGQKLKSIYVLSMFPYPSGAGLHVGHVRIYTGADVLARFFRMKGYSVLHPMGWDAFGLPAENAAIKAKRNPADMIAENIAVFKRQMMSLGLSYDWSREFSTADPEYYKWTQWLFIQFFKAGLLYKKETPVYFCEFCKTGLAQEEVLSDGTHERCGNKVSQKTLPQWIFRITKYADRLLEDLDQLDWPKGVIEMQKNWIGRSEGREIEFEVRSVKREAGKRSEKLEKIKVFTTRPETIDGVTFIAISPQKASELIDNGWKPNQEVRDYVKNRLENKNNKTGVATDIFAINPVNEEKIPIWVADYVMDDVGTGAIMGVPSYDQRDRAFANKFKLPIKKAPLNKVDIGEKKTIYHLRDWIFSRQRYWGEPIPMIFCEKCAKWLPEREENLPVKLPYIKSYEPTGTGESPLSKIKDWVEVKCPVCGSTARRETDTMPNWAGSCWYFIRFAQVKSEKLKVKSYPNIENWKLKIENSGSRWFPVDWYLGGVEHAVLHLLYARFWTKAMRDLGLVDFTEPFTKLRNVGIVLAQDHQKMSKSYGNVINPDDIIYEFGGDTLRVHEMFMAPFDSEASWSSKAIQGSYRFLTRIWQIYHSSANIAKSADTEDKELVFELQSLISKISSDITNVKFNTCISSFMEFINIWEKKKLSMQNAMIFLKLLAPFAPFMSEEIWREVFHEKNSIHLASWPEADESSTKRTNIKIPVQVNGKLRGIVIINDQFSMINKEKIVEIALKDPKVKKWVEGKKYQVVYVPDKILNFINV